MTVREGIRQWSATFFLLAANLFGFRMKNLANFKILAAYSKKLVILKSFITYAALRLPTTDIREVESIKVMLKKPSEYTRSIAIEIESEGGKIARFPEKV